MIRTLKTLKEKIDKMSLDANVKYYYLAGALDYIFEEHNVNLEAEIENTLKLKEYEKEKKPMEHPPFAPQISSVKPIPTKDPKPPLIKEKTKYSREGCKSLILVTLQMCGKGTYMQTHEIMKYNDMPDEATLYQMMSMAINELTDEKKVIKVRKTGTKGIQYQYCLPSDLPTKIVLNGEMVEQQRHV